MEEGIEGCFVRLLEVEKGKVVLCGEVEGIVFGPERSDGKGERSTTSLSSTLSSDTEEENPGEEADGGGGVTLPASASLETQQQKAPTDPRRKGQQRAKEREMVRQAARRGAAFGFLIDERDGGGDGEKRRKVECVQNGRVVESSFAKGEFGVRWASS